MKSVVVGMAEGELLASPWEYLNSKVPEEARRKILSRAKYKRSAAYEGVEDASVDVKKWRDEGESEIEIFGTWADLCVSSLVYKALDLGYRVYVPTDYIVPRPGKCYSPQTDEVLKYYRRRPLGEYIVFEPGWMYPVKTVA